MINMDVEAGIWRRAEKAKAIFHVIHDAIVSELDGLLRESIPHAVNNRALTKDLWSLRLTILQTLLPLNAPQLGLTDVLERVGSTRELRGLRSRFETALSAAGDARGNAKKAIVDDLFCENDQDIDVWNRPWNQPPPGWPSEMAALLERDYGSRLRVIAGIRELPDAGSQLVLVSPLQAKRFPLANAVRLLRPGRWASVHVLRYGIPIENDSFTRDDALRPSFARRFWRGEWAVQELTTGVPHEPDGQAAEVESGPADTIYDLDLERMFGDVDASTGEPEKACIVRLSSGCCVAHANDDPIRLLNRRQEWISALDLEEGDLIPVRVDDAGRQLLEEVATARMGGGNAEAVKRRLGAWKQVVRTCLGRHGEAKFRNEFNRYAGKDGHAWRDDLWTGETPWAPRSRKAFRAVILAANALGFFLAEQDIEKFIVNSWKDVQRLRIAHRLAGRDLVHQLDDELEQLVKQRSEWKVGDEVGLENGGRKYRVYEVIAVHDGGMLYPGQLRRLKKWPD
jgi:hypothetical protein